MADVRWGVVGPGGIATRFAEAMAMVDGGRVVAVASRSFDRAVEYGDRFGVPARYRSYDDLAASPDIDAVYVATPHSTHEALSVMFAGAGKHLLVEKPLALNEEQARSIVAAAQAANWRRPRTRLGS